MHLNFFLEIFFVGYFAGTYKIKQVTDLQCGGCREGWDFMLERK
jgi:hypothetical protein